MNEMIDLKQRIDLLRYNKQLLFRWIRRIQVGNPIDTFFRENRLEHAALYYWNEMSELLYYELKKAGICVAGVIDERKDLKLPLPVYSKAEELPDVDAIVICTALDSAKIEEELRKQKNCLIFTLDDLL